MDAIFGTFLFSTEKYQKLNIVSESLFAIEQYAMIIHIFDFVTSNRNVPFRGNIDFYIFVALSFYKIGEYNKCYECLTTISIYENCVEHINTIKKYIHFTYAITKTSENDTNKCINLGTPLNVPNFLDIIIIHKEYTNLSIQKLTQTLYHLMKNISDISKASNVTVIYRKTDMTCVNTEKIISELVSKYPFIIIHLVNTSEQALEKINTKSTYTFLLESGWIFTHYFPLISIYLNHYQNSLYVNEDFMIDVSINAEGKLEKKYSYDERLIHEKKQYHTSCVIQNGMTYNYYFSYGIHSLKKLDIRCIQPCLFQSNRYPSIFSNILFLGGNNIFSHLSKHP